MGLPPRGGLEKYYMKTAIVLLSALVLTLLPTATAEVIPQLTDDPGGQCDGDIDAACESPETWCIEPVGCSINPPCAAWTDTVVSEGYCWGPTMLLLGNCGDAGPGEPACTETKYIITCLLIASCPP